MYRKLESISDEILLTRITRFGDQMPEGYSKLGAFDPSPLHAVETMLHDADPSDTVLVTGSLYLIGEVRKLWRSKVEFWKDPKPARPPSERREDASNPAKPR